MSLNIEEVRSGIKSAKDTDDIARLFAGYFKAVFDAASARLYAACRKIMAEAYEKQESGAPDAEIWFTMGLVPSNLPFEQRKELLAEFPIKNVNWGLTDNKQICDIISEKGASFLESIGSTSTPAAFVIDDIIKDRADLLGYSEGHFGEGIYADTDLLAEDRMMLDKAVYEELKRQGYTTDEIYDAASMRKNTRKCRLLQKLRLETRDRLLYELEDFSERFKDARSALEQKEDRLREQCQKVYDDVIGALFDASGISQEDADKWAAENVYVSKDISKALDRVLYPESELRKDIAEFYRLCGGKLGPVEFTGSDKNNRACARGRSHIQIDRDFSKSALFHECGHLADAWNTPVSYANTAFIEWRSSAENTVPLVKLCGYSSGYRPDEMAYPDNFINPYVGKVYPGGYETEVMSMGMQMLASPEALAWFMGKDPEHFKLVLGECVQKNPALVEKLNVANNDAASKAATLIDRDNKLEAFHSAIKKAMPKNFREALLSADGVENCHIESSRRNKVSGSLYIYGEDGKELGYAYGKIASLLEMAYLYLASANGLLDGQTPDGAPYGTGEHIDFRRIKGDALADILAPHWFDPAIGLPKYQLPTNTSTALDAEKKQKKAGAHLKAAFIAALDAIIPQNLMNELKDGFGYEGLSVLTSFGGVYTLYWKRLQVDGHGDLVGEFTRDECLRVAALLLLHIKGLLPEKFTSDRKAAHVCANYGAHGFLPGWFEPDMQLPELIL